MYASRASTTTPGPPPGSAKPPELAASFGVRIALEFQKSSPICSCLETALALIAQSGAANAGVCFDVFHYYTGPSKFEDLAYLSPRNLAWVQVCDVSGTPRELAGDADRILPGEGDFQLGPIIDHLGRIGYDGYVSLEVLNPHLWQVAPDRVADLGHQALRRVLGTWQSVPPADAHGEGPEHVVRGDPPTRRGRVPRRAILRLAGLRPDRTGGTAHGTRFAPRPDLVRAKSHSAWSSAWRFLMFVVVFLLHMTTEVSPTDLRVWFGWAPTYPRIVAIHTIRSVEVVNYRPIADYGFWGIRAGRDGERAFIARGTRGVRLELIDGTRLLIGSQRPEALASVLDGALRPGV